MPEEIQVIMAGSRPLYEVVKSEDGFLITIRNAENHADKIELMSSAIGPLVQILRDIQK